MSSSRWGSTVIIFAGVICLIAAAILWWDLIADEAGGRNVFLPSLFTAMGAVWLVIGVRARGGRQPTGRDRGSGL